VSVARRIRTWGISERPEVTAVYVQADKGVCGRIHMQTTRLSRGAVS